MPFNYPLYSYYSSKWFLYSFQKNVSQAQGHAHKRVQKGYEQEKHGFYKAQLPKGPTSKISELMYAHNIWYVW